MNIGMGALVFFVSLIALVAEFILYFIFGFGAAFANQSSTLYTIAIFFVGLMIITGAAGILYPICTIIAKITNNKEKCNRIFLILMGIILVSYIGISLFMTKNIPKGTKEKIGSTQAKQKIQPPEKEYIDKYLVLKDVKIEDAYGKFDVPGYSRTKKAVKGNIKNIGDKNVVSIKIIVYFLDSQNVRVGEQDYVILSTSDMFDPDAALKPNYSKDFGYIIEDHAPPEWSGKVEVEISKIKFEDN